MGKKNDTATPAAAIAEQPKKKTAEPTVEGTEPTAVAKPPKAKAAAKKKPAARNKAPVVPFTTEDIALRAYFIAEARQRDGIHGDSHGDWIEAERQLKKEHKKKAAKKPAGKKRG